MKKINMVKSFLEGKEDIFVDKETENIFSKIHLNEDMFGFYVAHTYTNPDELVNKYESNLVFVYFPKKETVLFCPHSEIYHIQQLFGGYSICRDKQDVADALNCRSFVQTDIVEQLQNKYFEEQKNALLAKYPNFDSLPEDVKTFAIESRKTNLKEYYGTKNSFSSDERETALQGEKRNFSFKLPKVDDFLLTTTAILKGEREAINLLVSEETKEDKETRILLLASYYLHLQGIKEAEENLSENDKKKRIFYQATRKVDAKQFTVVYDSKKLLDNLLPVREKLKTEVLGYSRRKVWEKIFAYLDSHNELVFKADKDRGFSVINEFIEPWYTDMSNKTVFGLDRYDHIPMELEKALDNLDSLIDIKFRNKSIL